MRTNEKANAQMNTRYRYLYGRLFTPEEKKHLVQIIWRHQPILVGREDLKRRFAANLFKS